jgi:hypothetical protein
VRRREFITLLGGAAAVWPLAAEAQQSDRVRLIGVMGGGIANDPNAQANIAAFLQVLEKLGRTVGRNLRIESRQGAGNADDTRKYAVEVVALAPDVILSNGTANLGPLFAGDAHRADSVHDRRRPGWWRLRQYSGAAGRQRTPDLFNEVDIYDGSTLLRSFIGNTSLSPPGTQIPVYYFNVFAGSGEVITQLVLSSNSLGCCFETDNYSASINSVPAPIVGAGLPGMITVLGGAGLLGWWRRRKPS